MVRWGGPGFGHRDPGSTRFCKTREVLNHILSDHTGQPIERIAKDTNRDYYMTAADSKAYGLVDEILTKPPVDPDKDDDKS